MRDLTEFFIDETLYCKFKNYKQSLFIALLPEHKVFFFAVRMWFCGVGDCVYKLLD